jgi:hypothetical protein
MISRWRIAFRTFRVSLTKPIVRSVGPNNLATGNCDCGKPGPILPEELGEESESASTPELTKFQPGHERR